MRKYDKLIFEISKEGRQGFSLPHWDTSEVKSYIPKEMLREELNLPEVSEPNVARHYTNLSNKNYGVDTGFYPLGSCTMKYNPKINENMANLSGFASLHPNQDIEDCQGTLELMYNLDLDLSEITGMKKFTLAPFAGSHGELVGLMIMKAYHEKNGDTKRKKIIVPDSAHGTNPASATVAGFKTVEVKSLEDGTVDLESLKSVLDDEIAGIMLTNPNTAGIFEKNIVEVASLVHEAGGLLYYDGANLNAIVGNSRPGDMGFDIVHLNLHKTFSTPHGGGGPGAGPVGVCEKLIPFLPKPTVEKTKDKFILDFNREDSTGRVTGFFGNIGILVRAYTYILTNGSDGLKEISDIAVLNANYVQESLKDIFELKINTICKHEFVFSGLKDKSSGVTTLDIAKRLLDYGIHAPTIYFPLIIEQAMMIEPTENESKETLDDFIEVMRTIAKEANEDPEMVKNAPYTTIVRRLDEATAARKPILRWSKEL